MRCTCAELPPLLGVDTAAFGALSQLGCSWCSSRRPPQEDRGFTMARHVGRLKWICLWQVSQSVPVTPQSQMQMSASWWWGEMSQGRAVGQRDGGSPPGAGGGIRAPVRCIGTFSSIQYLQ